MKVLAAFLVILALLISIVPQFTDCESQGRMLTLQDGRQVSMKCHWTARAELVTGIPLAALGVAAFFSRRKESRSILGVLGMVLGALVVLLPTGLIGVCMNSEMLCNSFMKPFLILSGSLVIATSLAMAAFSFFDGQDNTPMQDQAA